MTTATPLTYPGLDVLRAQVSPAARELLAFLRVRRIGLLTNHTGRAIGGTPALDVLRELGLNIVALFSPEHGFAGTHEGHVESGQFGALPVHSLYGDTRRPTPEMLSEVDVLVCDLQDVGARFYTYASTIALCLEECLPRGIAVVVLDRPNPLGGQDIAGPSVDEAHRSFVGHLRVPIQHGLTVGELMRLHVEDEGLNDKGLHVVQCEGWTRDMTWPQTGLSWIAPSPNLPNFVAAAWYPALCLCEFSNVAVGRGTEAPFQVVGAPWMEPERVIGVLNEQHPRVPWQGSSVVPLVNEFAPTRAIYEGQVCRGVRFERLRTPATKPLPPVTLGLALLAALHRAHPGEFALDKALPLLGSSAALEMLRSGDVESALKSGNEDVQRFEEKRRAFLLYS